MRTPLLILRIAEGDFLQLRKFRHNKSFADATSLPLYHLVD